MESQTRMNISLPVGVIRLARIVSYDVNSGMAKVRLAVIAETVTTGSIINVLIPNAFYSDDGLYVGGLVKTKYSNCNITR